MHVCLHKRELFKETNFEAQNSFWSLGPHFFSSRNQLLNIKLIAGLLNFTRKIENCC